MAVLRVVWSKLQQAGTLTHEYARDSSDRQAPENEMAND